MAGDELSDELISTCFRDIMTVKTSQRAAASFANLEMVVCACVCVCVCVCVFPSQATCAQAVKGSKHMAACDKGIRHVATCLCSACNKDKGMWPHASTHSSHAPHSFRELNTTPSPTPPPPPCLSLSLSLSLSCSISLPPSTSRSRSCSLVTVLSSRQ